MESKATYLINMGKYANWIFISIAKKVWRNTIKLHHKSVFDIGFTSSWFIKDSLLFDVAEIAGLVLEKSVSCITERTLNEVI